MITNSAKSVAETLADFKREDSVQTQDLELFIFSDTDACKLITHELILAMIEKVGGIRTFTDNIVELANHGLNNERFGFQDLDGIDDFYRENELDILSYFTESLIQSDSDCESLSKSIEAWQTNTAKVTQAMFIDTVYKRNLTHRAAVTELLVSNLIQSFAWDYVEFMDSL